MSDIENKIENNAESKTTEAAPYMKKDSQNTGTTESSKSNLFIPLLLLLVSAIVIVATFYEDGYSNLVADADSISDTQLEASPSEPASNNIEMTDVNAITPEATAVKVQAVAVNTEIREVVTVQQDAVGPASNDHSSDLQTPAGIDRAPIKTAYTAYQRTPYSGRQVYQQSYEQARQKAKARELELANKHNEIMQQHRQAYEKEMQARRQQYEATMKAQQEKRAKIAEAQKAVFQRVEQNRSENNKRMLEMHEQISKMHDDIHQIMRESQPHFRNNSAPQMQQPVVEQAHSI